MSERSGARRLAAIVVADVAGRLSCMQLMPFDPATRIGGAITITLTLISLSRSVWASGVADDGPRN